MYCVINGHSFINEAQSVPQIFFPNEKFINVTAPRADGITVVSELKNGNARARLYNGEALMSEAALRVENAEPRMAVARSIFEACRRATGAAPPWGLLVGIRPTKIVHKMWGYGFTTNQIAAYLQDYYLVSEEKTRLCISTANAEKKFLPRDNDAVSLYIGIPFCVSRCLYCSFSSYLISRYKKWVGAYIAALTKELDCAAAYLQRQGKRLQTIYIGGGTPTSLDQTQFETLLKAVAERFNACDEYTVEAGRPDTVDEAKLQAMKNYGVTRVSINPQTLNDKTLEIIGRGHTAEDFYKAYNTALCFDFTINVDLIMGLTGEDAEDVRNTLKGVTALRPDNLTIHTLTVKRASMLKGQLNETELAKAADVREMLGLSAKTAEDLKLFPYYMYRQKNTLGNFENVGYCKANREGIYNIQMIEEKQTIVGAGAGAVTKHIDKNTDLLRRIYNVKTPEEYIKRIDEMIERKAVLYEYDRA